MGNKCSTILNLNRSRKFVSVLVCLPQSKSLPLMSGGIPSNSKEFAFDNLSLDV